jgi:hypothetical protein
MGKIVEDRTWIPRRVSWLPLYRVQGQGVYKEEGSPDRRVVSLREVLANLAYKLCHLVEYIWMWLSSWSCGHDTTWCDMVLLCFSHVGQPSLTKGSWPAPALALGLVFLYRLGFGRSGSCRLKYHGLLVLLANRCLETPRGYNPDNYINHIIFSPTMKAQWQTSGSQDSPLLLACLSPSHKHAAREEARS